jgi:hypothetical protein
MKRQNGLIVAAVVLLLSASALASTIGDPGGIIRRGISYDEFAIIGEGFTITFNGEPLSFPFNPFNFEDSFCPVMTGTFMDETVSGPDCQFRNESGQTIGNVSQFFAATPEELSPFTCDNQLQGDCSTGPGNALLFFGVGVPSAEEYRRVLLESTNTDPEFNILYFGFGTDTDLATINTMSIAAPEPASMGLLLSGLFGLGFAVRRKIGARPR